MNAEHTPTPWRRSEAKNCILGKSADSGLFTICVMKNVHREEQSSNQDFIIRAVNSHDALVEALENTLELLQWLQDSGNLKSPIEPHPYGLGVIAAKQQARAALAAAKGASK